MSVEDPAPYSSLGGFGTSKTTIGSLAQSARSKYLRQARWLLIVIGVLSLGGSASSLGLAQEAVRTQIQAEVNRLTAQGMQVDQAKVQEREAELVKSLEVSSVIGIVVGIVYIVLAIMSRRYPIPTMITATVIYVVTTAISLYSLYQSVGSLGFVGLIIPALITLALLKAVQSALAYERERRAVAIQADPLG